MFVLRKVRISPERNGLTVSHEVMEFDKRDCYEELLLESRAFEGVRGD